MAPGPSSARTIKSGTLTFHALPCAAWCTYQFKNFDGLVPGAPRLDACEGPGPDGAFSDVVLKAPTGARLLTTSITPDVDWDMFVCAKPARGNNGKMLGKNVNFFLDCQVACAETVTIKVNAGKSYVVRAYNAYDNLDLTGRYWFKS